ncbi:MAG: hypothetical protein ABEL76_14015 [Bradymonadaceae bacterium]
MNSRRSILVGAATLLAAGLAVRIAVGVAFPNWYWNDQVYQTLEPAHSWLFGYGQLPWEFREGLRSWILPGLLGAVMKLTAPLAEGSTGYLAGCTVFLSALSLIPAAVCLHWHEREYRWTDLLAAFAPLVWMELIYFAPKALYETFSAHLFIGALFLARFPRKTRWRLYAGGALLGLCCAVRIQLIPGAVAGIVAIALVADDSHRRFSGLVVGLLAGLALGGLIDWITWGAPFESIVNNYHENIVQNRAAEWGSSPATAYLHWMWKVSPLGTAMIGAATLVGLRLWPALAWPALTLFAAHSAIDHKEYRFLYPVLVLGAAMVGLGAARLTEWSDDLLPMRHARGLVAVVLGLSILGNSVHAAATFRLDTKGEELSELNWTRRRGIFLAFRHLSTRSDLCGVGIRSSHHVGGYSYLHRDIPIVTTARSIDLASERRFDAYVAIEPARWGESAGPFRRNRCVEDVCLYIRPGGCRDSG